MCFELLVNFVADSGAGTNRGEWSKAETAIEWRDSDAYTRNAALIDSLVTLAARSKRLKLVHSVVVLFDPIVSKRVSLNELMFTTICATDIVVTR